jgi:ADP-heptose:LPS heptosyltransferase
MKTKLPIRNILVVQLAKMGDFLQTTPLLQRIKRKYPEADLSVLIDSRNAELAGEVPFLKHIIPLNLNSFHGRVHDPTRRLSQKYHELTDWLQKVRDRKFDIVYNINFSRISALLCQFFKGARIIGYRLHPETHELMKENWVSFVFHLMNDRKLIRFNFVDLLAAYESEKSAPGGSSWFHKSNGVDPNIPFLCEGKKTIGLQLGCGGDLRRWPVDSFATLASRLVQEKWARVILFGSPEEYDLGQRFLKYLRRLSGQEPPLDIICNLIGKTNISQLTAALKKCDLLVTGDTGTMHLAAAVGTKILALFMGTALCHETGPYGEGHFVIQALLPCSPCNEGKNSCIRPACRQAISPNLVYEILIRILDPTRSPDNPVDGIGPSIVDDRIQIYKTTMDDWGVKFLPLLRNELNTREIMALAYREVGRNLISPSYPIAPQKINKELSIYYNRLNGSIRHELEHITKNLNLMYAYLGIVDKNLTPRERKAYTDWEATLKKYCSIADVLQPLYRFFLEIKSKEAVEMLQPDKIIGQPNKDMQDMVKKILTILSGISHQ